LPVNCKIPAEREGNTMAFKMIWNGDNPLKILVGTANPGKIAPVQEIFAQMFGKDRILVQGENAKSGVSDQPRTSYETWSGAKNRANYLFDKYKNDFHLFIGPEGGVRYPVSQNLQVLNWMVIQSSNGQMAGSFDTSYPLPPMISQGIENGLEMGTACDNFLRSNGIPSENIKQKGGIDGIMSDGWLSRDQVNINMAMQCMTGFQDIMNFVNDNRAIEYYKYKLSDPYYFIAGRPFINVALGSESKTKAIAAQNVFQLRFKKEIQIKPFDVEQEICHLSARSEEEIFNMAMQRTLLAERKAKAGGFDYEFAVGIQSGIIMFQRMPMVISAAIIRGPDGYTGHNVGAGYTLLPEFYKLIMQCNGDATRASNIYFKGKIPADLDVQATAQIGMDGEFSRGHMTTITKLEGLICSALNQFIYRNFYESRKSA